MSTIAIAAPSPAAADAGLRIAAAGGGAVDAAIAAALVSMISEPGVAAPGAGAFVTVDDPDGGALVYDGYMAAPGLDGPVDDPELIVAAMEYGGGITTLVGAGSVAVPGAWAAFDAAHAAWGRLEWASLFEPVVDLAESGVILGRTSAIYLGYSHEAVFGHDPVGRAALHPHGRNPVEGTVVVVPGLAESLGRIAEKGADDLYRGRIGRAIADDITARGGRLGRRDLEEYRAVVREPLVFRVGPWTVSTNPPPSVGGAAMFAIVDAWMRDPAPGAMIAAQERIFRWRRTEADRSTHRESTVARFLDGLGGDPLRSPSTAHVSVVDELGFACSLTLSAGYGSGVIPRDTGLWMNNALGELELVGDGSHLRPGDRLNSNMAPTVARHEDGSVLAIGSPGADRITTAIGQTLIHHLGEGLPLEEAVAHPRMHVSVDETAYIAVEPGLQIPDSELPVRPFEELHMYFGGVGAVERDRTGRMRAVSDPRRNGVGVVGP